MAKGFPGAIVALVIGAIAAYIAWHQYKTGKAKLKLDLFDKRYKVFLETWRYLSSAICNEQPVSPTNLPFSNLIPKAAFLFGPEIEAYLQEASNKMIVFHTIAECCRKNGNVMRPEDIQIYAALTSWFSNEASVGAKKRFEKFLDFRNWR